MYDWSNEGSSQDSGVRGRGIHLFPQTHQGCIYKWKISTEDLLNMNREPQSPKRTRRSHAIKQDEGKRKGKRSRMGVAPPGSGELKVRRGSRLWESPLISREISWDKRRASGLSEECIIRSVAGRTEWDLHRWSMHCPAFPQPEMCGHGCTWGLGARMNIWRADPGRGMLLVMRWQPGDGSADLCSWEFLGRKSGSPQKQSAFIEWHAKDSATIAVSLLITGHCLQGHHSAHAGVACKPLVSISSAPSAWVAHFPHLPLWLSAVWWGCTY